MAKILIANATSLFGRIIEKMVDITEDCQIGPRRRALLIYTRHGEQPRVELIRSYPALDIRVDQAFYLTKLRTASINKVFTLWADRLGIEPSRLKELIFEHAPAAPVSN